MTKICIVTTRHISYNPRVLKEADALSAAGYEVSVVTVSNSERQAAFDEELMSRRSWRLRTVNFRKERAGERRYWLFLSLKQRVFLVLSRISYRGGIAERAAEKAYDALKALAIDEKAGLYIAHHAEALGAAYRAARSNGARFGFDAEDFHTGMNETGTVSAQDKLVEYLETNYLPHLSYMTAASKGIGEAYVNKYGVKQPLTILNVFPYEELAVGEVSDPVKFYWYSQVIGPNRGIELLLEAASRISLPFEIHLRGSLQSEEYRERLKSKSTGSGLWDKIHLHEPILAERLIADANRFDVGLALESDISVNRNICVTNKVFSYLMSRLFIIGTDTYGQKEVFTHFPDAVRICRRDDPEDLADAMRSCIAGKTPVMEGKRAAGKAAEQRFNWDVESTKLLDLIDSIFKLKFVPMNSFITEILASNTTSDENGNMVQLSSSIHREEVDFISAIIKEHHLYNVVEVGCAMGISSLAIADAIKGVDGAFHYIIDPHQESQWKNIGVTNLKKAGFRNFKLIEDYSEFVLPALAKEGVRVNFGFIDGWHTFDHTLIDIFYINRMLEIGGVIVIDDGQMPAINKVIRYLYNYPCYQFIGSVVNKEITSKRKLFDNAVKIFSGLKYITGQRIAAELYNPKLLRSDKELGLNSTMIAFKKISPDKRDWNWYANF